jgi:hypothetical protein
MSLLRVDQYERPHRSGVIAIISVYAALYLCAIPFRYQGEHGAPSLACTIAPFLPACMEQDEIAQEEQKKFEVTKLVYCPKCPVRPKPKEPACIWRILHADGRGADYFTTHEDLEYCVQWAGQEHPIEKLCFSFFDYGHGRTFCAPEYISFRSMPYLRDVTSYVPKTSRAQR